MTVSNTIEVVAHCWAVDLADYAHLLYLQGLSLVRQAELSEGLTVRWTVCCNEEDSLTTQAIERVRRFDEEKHLRIKVMPLDKNSLFKRSVGRNLAALASTADVVWFTDCDYVFFHGSLEEAHRQCMGNPHGPMVYPSEIQATPKDVGAHVIKRAAWAQGGWALQDVLRQSEPMLYSRAIGGVQIVLGGFCRRYGYLNNHPKNKPLRGKPAGFKRCRCDVTFRRQGKAGERVGTGTGVQIDGVYRIRHPLRGHNGTPSE